MARDRMRNEDGRGRWRRERNRYVIDGDHASVELRRKNGPPLVMLMDIGDLPILGTVGRVSAIRDNSGKFYAGITIPDWRGIHQMVRFHRFLTKCPDGMVVDHINHNELDNRRSNLRVTTNARNILNRRGPAADKRSCRYRGVFRNRDRWRARVTVDGFRYNLGTFTTPDDAHEAVTEFVRGVLAA